jgi:hypothetical protein
MARYDYYQKINQEGDIEFFDTLSLNFQDFTFTSQPTTYLVDATDVLKPWFISERFFGTVDYTDLLLQINGVVNPLSDMMVDMVFIIPSLDDIKNFILNNKNFS